MVPPYEKGFVVPVTSDGNIFKGHFTPKQEGLYELNVFQKGNRIAGSPFPVTVTAQGN